MGLLSSGAGYCNMGFSGFPAVNGAQSHAYWFRYTGALTGNQLPLNMISTSGSGAVQIGFRTGVYGCYGWGGGAKVTVAAAPTVNVWHHVVYTYLSPTHTMYIDGAFSNSSTTAADAGAVTSMEVFGNQWGENFAVELEDMRVYTRAVSLPEVETIYAAYGCDFIVESLVARWLFDESPQGTNPGSVTSLKDRSINSNNSTAFSNALTGYTYQDVLLKLRTRIYQTLR
jgi:hypothetical protein